MLGDANRRNTHQHTTGTLAHAPYPMSAPSPCFALVYHTTPAGALQRPYCTRAKRGTLRACRRTLLLCEAAEGRTTLTSCSAARALRRYSRNAARPSTAANTTAVGMTAAMMMVLRGGPLDAAAVAACPAPVRGDKPRDRVSSESGFAQEHHCQYGQGAKVAF